LSVTNSTVQFLDRRDGSARPGEQGARHARTAAPSTNAAVSSPYALTYRAVVTQTGQVLTVTGSGSTRSACYPTAQLNLNGTQTIEITAALPSTPSWTSVPATQTIGIALLGLLPSCGASS
jgi:hypothetical protein